MADKESTWRLPTAAELVEAKRIAALSPAEQRRHPTAAPADISQLRHINTYGFLPEFYIDIPFVCRDCGQEEIWKAAAQKWYFEVAKAHTNSKPVRCYSCRKSKREKEGRGRLN